MGLFARTKSIVVVALASTALSLGAYGFLVYYIFHTHGASAELARAVDAELEKELGLRATGRLLQELTEEEVSISSRFVGADDIVAFIELLESSGKDAGIALEVVSVGIAPEEGDSHEWLTVSLKGRGAWEKLFHFVMLLETTPFVIELDNVSLKFKAEDEAGRVGVWEGLFTIRAAKLKPPEP